MEQTAQERVTDAINALYAETGTRPTLAAVRNRLGGGSMTTISEAMKLWRKHQQESTMPAAIVVPEDIHAAITATLTGLWQQAMVVAEARFATERESMQAEKGELEAQLAETEDAMAVLEEEKAAAQAACAALQQKLDELEARYQQQEIALSQHERLAQELTATQQLAQEREKQLAVTAERLHQQENACNTLEQQQRQTQDALLEQQTRYGEVRTQVAVLEAENCLLSKQIEQYGQILGHAALVPSTDAVDQKAGDVLGTVKNKAKTATKPRKTGGAA